MPAYIPVITIDGPSGVGKGTVGVMLARKLNFHFLESGVLYRVLALKAFEKKVALDDIPGLVALAGSLELVFELSKHKDTYDVLLEGRSIKQVIRDEVYGAQASVLAVHPEVREALLRVQRAFCQLPGLVADGRDMGTVVFPEATFKIFLEADLEIRAKRRYEQLKRSASSVTLQEVLDELAKRDKRDKTREAAPLVPAADAFCLDTSSLSVQMVFEKIWDKVQLKLKEVKMLT